MVMNILNKKVIFINYMFCSNFGGGENYDYNLSKELITLGYKVEIISTKSIKGISNTLEMGNMSIKTIGRLNPYTILSSKIISKNKIAKVIISPILRFTFRSLFQLGVIIRIMSKNEEPAIIHICGLMSLAAILSKIQSKHKVFLRMPGPPLNIIHNTLLNNVDNIIANGNAYEKIKGSLSIPNKLVNMSIGINKELFRAEEFIPYRKEDNLEINICFVGRLEFIKDPILALKIVENLAIQSKRNICFYIVGDGSLRNKLDIEINRRFQIRNLQIQRLGQVNKLQVSKIMKKCDLFLLTSKYDNHPNVLIEAISSGLIPICTDVGGISKIYTHNKEGIITNSRCEKDIANEINSLLESKAKLMTYKKNLSVLAKSYKSWNTVAKDFVDLF